MKEYSFTFSFEGQQYSATFYKYGAYKSSATQYHVYNINPKRTEIDGVWIFSWSPEKEQLQFVHTGFVELGAAVCRGIFGKCKKLNLQIE